MLDEEILKLYSMMFSPLITPYNLLENAKLENYEYVNYTKCGEGLLVTMRCLVEENFSAVFSYYFDQNDHLNEVIMDSSDGREIIFNREMEAQKLKDRIMNVRRDKLSLAAV